ncbi:hypothetical protein NFI96_023134 [Prochilodus magdalenae]|nr:hypothetical protein NFI96_023134 [Prochilodus magdalenae]
MQELDLKKEQQCLRFHSMWVLCSEHDNVKYSPTFHGTFKGGTFSSTTFDLGHNPQVVAQGGVDEDDLSCPVCCEVYQDPRLLPCGHSFCHRCLEKHWGVSRAQTCPVCRQTSPQKPVANLVLRNACESYLKEKERKKNDGEVRCSQHGEKLELYCKTDEQAICSECRKHNHGSHRVQPLAHAVRQRKSQVKVALRPAEKALEALKKGTTQNSQITKYIDSQVRQAERLIRKEFEGFHQFLREEEEARITSLKKEAARKRGKVQKRIDREIESLTERVKEVEEEMESDGATFLQNFDSVLKRAEYTERDSEFGSGSLICMPEHVGNLGYRVWERMMEVIHYFQQPNQSTSQTSPATKPVHQPNQSSNQTSPTTNPVQQPNQFSSQQHPMGSVLWAASCGPRPVGSVLWAASCGPRPVGSVLWAASCGPRPVGSVLWAASCGQRPVGSVLWVASFGQCPVGNPVVLDPNTAPANLSISEDLAGVGISRHDRPIPVSHRGNQIALGSEGYTDGMHCWDVEVGNCKHWTIGVCQRFAATHHTAHPLIPERGFWGLSCNRDAYRLLESRSRTFRLKKKPRVVRVELGWHYYLDKNIWEGWRTVSFIDADDESMFAVSRVPPGVELFPFLVPEERFSSLRIAPARVGLTVHHRFPPAERKTQDIVYGIVLIIVSFLLGLLLRHEAKEEDF